MRKHCALLVEVEAIVNSRPLSADLLSDESIEPLTPNQLLTMKTKVVLPPPGIFQKADVYRRKRWRAVQHLANVFWSRLKKEYLVTLQPRQKWASAMPNLENNDIVMEYDLDVNRNRWPLGNGLLKSIKVKMGWCTRSA